uniref:hypothetical protein n=1 Tax=Hassallia byssoidea TaxID=482630 RepID=UPI001911DDC3|nr:hypothetical protein [Hassalia byssoidea]
MVLDNFDVLLNNNQAGNYRVGYEEYGELLQRVGEVPHQSCLILTSQKKPAEVAALAGEIYPIRCLQLSGLNNDAAQRILAAKGISASVDDEERLIEFYCGNPLALKIAATSILDLFDGSIADFLEEVVRSPRPYANMITTGMTSLNPQKATLKTLAALELVSNYQSTSKVLEFPAPRYPTSLRSRVSEGI